MTKRRLPVSKNHPLGTLGLLLILVVAKLAGYLRLDPSHPQYKHRAQAFFARRAIDAVTAIGWVVDRLGPRLSPLPAFPRSVASTNTRPELPGPQPKGQPC
jgi:hypothetical protein